MKLNSINTSITPLTIQKYIFDEDLMRNDFFMLLIINMFYGQLKFSLTLWYILSNIIIYRMIREHVISIQTSIYSYSICQVIQYIFCGNRFTARNPMYVWKCETNKVTFANSSFNLHLPWQPSRRYVRNYECHKHKYINLSKVGINKSLLCWCSYIWLYAYM